jgi:hypothetical protein
MLRSVDTDNYRQPTKDRIGSSRYLPYREEQVMNSHIVGFDPGNSDATLTITSNGRPAACTIPAFLGSGSLEELKRIRGGSGKKDGLEAGELVLETAEQSAFVGKLALEQSADASSARGDRPLLVGPHPAVADDTGRDAD